MPHYFMPNFLRPLPIEEVDEKGEFDDLDVRYNLSINFNSHIG